jgi:hypothetical protein
VIRSDINGPYVQLSNYNNETMYIYAAFDGVNISNRANFSYVRVKEIHPYPLPVNDRYSKVKNSDVILLELITPMFSNQLIKLSNGTDGNKGITCTNF